jgi:hypothetical protein
MRTYIAEPVSFKWNVVHTPTGQTVARFQTAMSAWAHAEMLEQKALLAHDCTGCKSSFSSSGS